MRAYKVFETQNFERGVDPMDSMKLGDVQGRLLKIRRAEAIQAMEEILDTYGGDGPFFLDENFQLPLGFKIAIYRDEPIQSRYQLKDGNPEIRYYIEYNAETEVFFVGWEQEDSDGKWKDRQWTSKIPFGKINIMKSVGDIKTTEQAKHIMIEYIRDNKQL